MMIHESIMRKIDVTMSAEQETPETINRVPVAVRGGDDDRRTSFHALADGYL